MIAKPVTGSVAIGVNGVAADDRLERRHHDRPCDFRLRARLRPSITAGFQFDVPVRFDTDQLALTAENYAMYKADIPIVEMRGMMKPISTALQAHLAGELTTLAYLVKITRADGTDQRLHDA